MGIKRAMIDFGELLIFGSVFFFFLLLAVALGGAGVAVAVRGLRAWMW
jgi:hypothetical protein